MFGSNTSTAKVLLVEKEEETKKGFFSRLKDSLTPRFKHSTETIPPIEKTEEEKRKDFIVALGDQDLAQIKSYISQENFDVNKPLEIETLTYEVRKVQLTPLEIVLRAKTVKPEVLRALMEKGVKLELSKPGDAVNLAHSICKPGKIINKHEIIKTLSEREEFVEQLKIKNPDDESTVLHSLAQNLHSQQEAIKFLVEDLKLNVNEPDSQGNTPLHVARCVGNATQLTKSGANYWLKNNDQSTPLDREIERHDLLGEGEIKFRRMITEGVFPITVAIIKQELSNNLNKSKSQKEIEMILMENTKENNHPYLTGQLTFRSGQRMQLDRTYQRVYNEIRYFSLREQNNSKTTSVDRDDATEQPERTVKKSSISSETSSASANIQSRERRKDRYAGCPWLNPVAGPRSAFHSPLEQRKQEEQQEQAAKGKKAESLARPSYSR